MKDLDSPEQRAMERETLRAARDGQQSGGRDYTHVGIAAVLFAVAITLYVFGQVAWAGLVAVGAIVEIGAWAILMSGGRTMPKVEPAQPPGDKK